jgi:hypothetical protein
MTAEKWHCIKLRFQDDNEANKPARFLHFLSLFNWASDSFDSSDMISSTTAMRADSGPWGSTIFRPAGRERKVSSERKKEGETQRTELVGDDLQWKECAISVRRDGGGGKRQSNAPERTFHRREAPTVKEEKSQSKWEREETTS